MSNFTAPKLPSFSEHRIPRYGGSLHVRDFPGSSPAFVVLHGFPDNSHIFDYVIEHLNTAGRRVVAFDFLGFGDSDKPVHGEYNFQQQLGDLEAVVNALHLEKVIVVGHDAGGPAAVNYALKHPEKTAAVVLMNAFYGHHANLRVPEIIEFFSIKTLAPLHKYFVSNPAQFGALFAVQRPLLQQGLTEEQRNRYDSFLSPVVDVQFRQQPSAIPAFVTMTSHLNSEVAANTARLSEFRNSTVPFLFIWGKGDPYLHITMAEDMRSQARSGILHALEAGHWPQIDAHVEVAEILLSEKWTNAVSESN